MDPEQPAEERLSPPEPLALSPEQLQGVQWGVAATIMPVDGCWRVGYFSLPDFRDQPGTDFSTFDAAISAIVDVLPVVNSEEQRERASQELRAHLQRSIRSADDQSLPETEI